MRSEGTLVLENLLVDPYNRELDLHVVPLYLLRGEERMIMPDGGTPLQAKDRILFCGVDRAYYRMRVFINDYYLLQQVILKKDIPRSSVLRKLGLLNR